MSDFTPAFVAAARASTQTTFASSDRLPDDDSGAVFVTDVDDAPLQVLGRLGRDGKWYVGTFIVVPLDQDAPMLPGALVLRDEPVAEALIRYGINQLLNAVLAGDVPQGFAAFKARLMASRFRQDGHA